jgi:hypothetical protein
MTPTHDLEHLIKTLNIKTGAELGERTMRDALEAMPNIETAKSLGPQSNMWRTMMKSKIAKFTVTAAALSVAVALALYYFGEPFPGSNIAWGAVIKPIFNAKTAAMDLVIGTGGKQTVIHDEVMGSRIRRALASSPNYVVIDLKEKKILTLDHKDKTAVFVGLEGLGEIGNYIEILRNTITELQAKADFRVENKGIQKLQSRDCVVFVARCKDQTLTIWADPETAAPIRIEQKTPNLEIACDNIRFDVPLDEALFSIDVPAGYKTLQGTGIDFKKNSETDFIETLRIWAQVMDGRFPDRINIEYIVENAPRFGRGLDVYMKQKKLTEQQVMALGIRFGQGLVFIRFFKGQGQWHYAGQGVRLGDGREPIFWYQPKKSQTWRVIFGDLRVEDIARDALTKLEAASAARIRLLEKQPKFEGRQTDQWHITASGSISAHCSLKIDNPPAAADKMPIALPYPSGKLQSAKLRGRELQYKDSGKGRYELTLPEGWASSGKPTFEFVWTMPLDGLERDAKDFRAILSSVIPVCDYSLDVILDEGCGYEFTKPFANLQRSRPFNGSAPTPVKSFGTCNLSIRKAEKK